jgi:hypothetical protein
MATRSGNATADLLALLKEHCPEVAEETLAALAAIATDPAAGGLSGTAGGASGTAGGASGAADAAALRWRQLTLGQIPGVSEVLSTVEAPLQVVLALLRFIAGILEVISALLLAIPDPIKALILAAYNLLKTIIDDFLASGCYLYFDAPGFTSNLATLSDMGVDAPPVMTWLAGDPVPGRQGVDGFAQWAFRFEQSFDDPGDEHRPIFSDGAPVEALFIVATAPQLVDLGPVLTILAQLLDLKAFQNAWDKFLATAPDPDRARLNATSVAPDWRSWKLRDIPGKPKYPGGPPTYPLRQLEKVPELLKSLLLNVDNIVQLIKDLVQAVQDKIALLTQLIEIIQAVIDMLQALSATGLHALAVATDEGVAGLKKAFLEAENRPNTDAQGNVLTAHAIVGVCLLAGTTNVLPLWALLGEGASFEQATQGLQDDWQELTAQAEAALEDTKAIATEAWEGAQTPTGTAQDLGVQGLWGGLSESFNEQKDTVLHNLGLSEQEADEQARSNRNALMTRLEQTLQEGNKLDPRVLAHIEATRRARRRGRRSLAMATEAQLHPPQDNSTARRG